MGKLGFCCLYREDGNPLKEKEMNPRKIMLTNFASLSKKDQENKIREVVVHNLNATKKILEYTNSLHNNLKLLRISSDLLPLYTAQEAKQFYQIKEFNKYIREELYYIGEYARKNNIRIGFHPDQFCVLASLNEKAVVNGMSEFIYHLEIVEMMGYKGWHEYGTFINIHTGSKNISPLDILTTLKKMPENSINFLTIENDEFSHGIDSTLKIADKVALVLDVHHHWIATGEYLNPEDNRVKDIVKSWKNIKPLMHYSITHEDVIVNANKNIKPDLNELKKNGYKAKDLRKHSEYYWNNECNLWIKGFLNDFDIECEAKGKNLASNDLYKKL